MTRTVSILALPGDGIGPEVTEAALGVAEAAARLDGIALSVQHDLIGGAALDRHGIPITPQTVQAALAADAVVLGAVGGPRWQAMARDKRPESGLLTLRQKMGVFANLRPALCRPALVAASSLKPERVAGLDVIIVRELTGGIYFGAPRYRETLADGSERAVDTQVYTQPEIARVCRVAFDIATARGSLRLCSVDKANVMETGRLWREVADAIALEYPDVALSHMYVDTCAMELVREPRQFDTIVTDNLFGDILSDCAAMLTGSLGMLPSASLGDRPGGLFEPVHGSAPDIAGAQRANPLAMILSVAMAFRYALGSPPTADRIERAVDAALDAGIRTADIADDEHRCVSTTHMARAVEERLT